MKAKTMLPEFNCVDNATMLASRVEVQLRMIDSAFSDKANARSADVVPDQDVDSHFGGYPHCHGSDGMLSPNGNHWFICRQHMTCWSVGWNLFSAWKQHDESENVFAWLYLQAFWQVEPYHAPTVKRVPSDVPF